MNGTETQPARRFAGFAWIVVAFNLVVVLWGALVRATGSGAGCGGHWPLCNGEVLPSAASQATTIEFIHRLLSGFAFVLVAALWVWALRRFPRRHAVRSWAWLSLALIVVEALVGAGLVLLHWVGEDASTGRAVSIAVHLIITFALLASLTLVAWRAGPGRSAVPPPVPIVAAVLLIVGIVIVGMSGAITALGDTLFPPQTLGQGLAQDIAPGAHFLLRLRALHPLLASVVVVAGMVWADGRRRAVEAASAKWRLTALRGLLLIQLALGAANVILLAPVWLQILHLLLANLVWLLLVVCLAEAAPRGAARQQPDQPEPSPSKIS
jgi:heme A synthase